MIISKWENTHIGIIYSPLCTSVAALQLFFFKFYFNPSLAHLLSADAYSSLILLLGPGQLSDPVFLIFFFFFQKWKFYIFSELICLEHLSPHISWSPLNYLKNNVNGTQYLLNLQSNKDFSCSFVINHCCKGEKANSSHLQTFNPQAGKTFYGIQTGKGVFRSVCLTTATWKMPAPGLQYMVYFKKA